MAKVTDMGLSKVLNSTQQLKADGAGSNLLMAPELLKYQYYDKKVDCYSFALLIWQILTWTQNPFQEYLDRGDLDAFVEAVYYQKVRPAIPPNLKVHPKLIQLMNTGWAHSPKDRPDFTEFVMGLDDCLISTLFKDEEYANFWKQNWGAQMHQKEQRVVPAKEVISWNTFIQAFYEYLKKYGVKFPKNPESDVYYLSFKAILIDGKNDSVNLERLLLVEKWFGPMYPSQTVTLFVGNEAHLHSNPSVSKLILTLPGPTLDLSSSRKSPITKSARTESKTIITSNRPPREPSQSKRLRSRSISVERNLIKSDNKNSPKNNSPNKRGSTISQN